MIKKNVSEISYITLNNYLPEGCSKTKSSKIDTNSIVDKKHKKSKTDTDKNESLRDREN